MQSYSLLKYTVYSVRFLSLLNIFCLGYFTVGYAKEKILRSSLDHRKHLPIIVFFFSVHAVSKGGVEQASKDGSDTGGSSAIVATITSVFSIVSLAFLL